MYVEQRPAAAPKEDRAPAQLLMFSSEGGLQAERPAAEPGVSPWGVYSCTQSVDSLAAFLDPQGQRESALKRVRHSMSAPSAHDRLLTAKLGRVGLKAHFLGRTGLSDVLHAAVAP